VFFENLLSKFKLLENRTKITGTLREGATLLVAQLV